MRGILQKKQKKRGFYENIFICFSKRKKFVSRLFEIPFLSSSCIKIRNQLIRKRKSTWNNKLQQSARKEMYKNIFSRLLLETILYYIDHITILYTIAIILGRNKIKNMILVLHRLCCLAIEAVPATRNAVLSTFRMAILAENSQLLVSLNEIFTPSFLLCRCKQQTTCFLLVQTLQLFQQLRRFYPAIIVLRIWQCKIASLPSLIGHI